MAIAVSTTRQDSVEGSLGGAFALSVLLSLARALGLKKAYDIVRKTLNESPLEFKVSRASTAAQDEHLLLAIHDFLVSARVKLKEKPVRPWDDDTYIPESELCAAPFGPALTELLVRSIADPALSEKRRTLLDAAVTLLSPEGMNRFAAAWSKSYLEEALSIEALRDVVDALVARQCAPVPLLRMLLVSAAGESWERAVALLYHRGGEAGRKAARELAALYPPPLANAQNKRRQFTDPYQGTVWAAWLAKDTEFLAIACERCLIPYSMKGALAIVPEVPPIFHRMNDVASTREQNGVPLADVWQHVRNAAPQRVSRILNAALKFAEADEFPRLLLELEAEAESKDSPLLSLEDGVVALLESSQAPVVTTGLTILSHLPASAGKRKADAIKLCAQALSGSQADSAKLACSALVALADTFSDQRAAVLEKLSFALALENTALLQQVIRGIKHVRGSGKTALALSKSAAARLQELAADDPAKFQKLVQPLLK